MTEREALKLALEAFEWNYNTDLDNIPAYEKWAKMLKENITAIRETLSQPEQEPLEYWNAVEGWVKIDEVRQHFDSVGCGTIYKTAGEDRVPLYTSPPACKPLTDEELYKVFPAIATYTEANKTLYRSIARAIEAAHGIKGEA